MIAKILTLLLSLSYLELGFGQNVIIVVMDGARYTETVGATSTYTPHIYNDLKPLGTLYTNFRIDAASGGVTLTNPGHATIATGTWQSISNNGGVYPSKPTVFEYFRKAAGLAETQTYLLAGKSKLEYVKYSESVDFGNAFQAHWSGNDNRNDQQVYDLTLTAMNTDHPRLLMINLAEVDQAAHYVGESAYRTAITNADNIVYLLWSKLQEGYAGYTTANTTMFVVNDHGRHTTDFTGHGDACEGCTHIMLLTLGRNVTAGIVNSDLHYQIDVAPTIGDLLGFSTPQAVGTSLYQGSNPLPVELISFTASASNDAVALVWSTATEVSNYGFEIERRQITNQHINQSSINNWTKIGFVAGYGTSNSPHTYSFEDNSASSGRFVYRLKQIDKDGTFKYSSEAEVSVDVPTETALGQNFPNPFNPTTAIRYQVSGVSNQLTAESRVLIAVYDLLGREVAVLVNEMKQPGRYSVLFDASGLSSGIYIYRLDVGESRMTKRLTLIR